MEQIIIDALAAKQPSDTYISFISEKVKEKTVQQLEYVLSPVNENIFLEACAGSGKTEVVGMKTAYEICRWNRKNSGIAVLTFTNEATDTIKQRVEQFTRASSLYPHYVGTLTGFIHGIIAQKFGYKYFKHKKEGNDATYRLVDKDLDVYNNHWLNHYTLPIPKIINSKKRTQFFANQVYYNPQIKDFVLRLSENTQMSLTDYYNSDKVQEFILEIRKEKKKEWLFKLDYYYDGIKEVKNQFFLDGFANFEDMNYIAYWVLNKNPEIALLLAKRYPVIFIDECQDLSWIEINILDKITKSGSTIHFIGDLNQAIYDFKNANPAYTKDYVSTFQNYKLTDNFRSCQLIVNTASRILSSDLNISGCLDNKLGENSVCYLEYQEVGLLRKQYLDYLNHVNIPYYKAAVLVRQQSLKMQLEAVDSESKHLLIESIQLWLDNTPTSRLNALELAGKYLQKYFGGANTKKNYYCPNGIDSVYRWRIFIKDFLEKCCEKTELFNIENRVYKDWYAAFNKMSSSIFLSAYSLLKPFDSVQRDVTNLPVYRTPSGTSSNLISRSFAKVDDNLPPVYTIHSVKGKDFDSVMVVSGLNGSGNWKQWIEKEGEPKRIGYVANTRPKYSLLWAVPELKNTKDRIKIESYGFKILNSFIHSSQ